MNYSMPSPTPGACSDSCPSSRWCHPTISSHPLFSHSPPSLVQLLQRYSQTHSTVYIINTNNKLVCSFLDKYIFPVEKECVSWHINGCSPFHYLNSGVVRPKIKLVFEKIFLGIPGSQWLGFMFSVPWAWVQSLIRELRSHKPHCAAKI